MTDIEKHIYIASSSSKHPIIVYKEAHKTSVNQIKAYFERLNLLSQGLQFHYLIDLTNTSPPSAEVRHHIKKELYALDSSIISYHVIIGNNFLLKVALKFVGASIGLVDYKSHNSIDNAIKFIEREY